MDLDMQHLDMSCLTCSRASGHQLLRLHWELSVRSHTKVWNTSFSDMINLHLVSNWKILEAYLGSVRDCGCWCPGAKAPGHQQPQYWHNPCCSRAVFENEGLKCAVWNSDLLLNFYGSVTKQYVVEWKIKFHWNIALWFLVDDKYAKHKFRVLYITCDKLWPEPMITQRMNPYRWVSVRKT